VNDPELLRQRRAAGADPSDPRPLYRYRVMVLKAGAPLRPVPGDQVALDDEDDEGRVVRVREVSGGPQEVTVRIGERLVKVQNDALKIVSPHRPAVLLGEDELAKRLEEDVQDPHDPRALETLGEVARRRLKAGIPVAVDLMSAVSAPEAGPDEPLRKVLTQICRGRPFGEVEVELLHRKLAHDQADLVSIPPLAAAAPDADAARELLDRFEAMEDHDQARLVVLACGRNLVGAGGPGFVDADLRQRVSTMSREHPDHGVRVALFLHAVPVLQTEDVLMEKALPSTRGDVRGCAVAELKRRGKLQAILTHAADEEDPIALRSVVEVLPAPFPADLAKRCLKAGRKDAVLEEAILLRLPEIGAGPAAAALAPWLKKGRKTNIEAAVWAAGQLPKEEVGADLLKLMSKFGRLDLIALAVEGLARMGHEAAAPALDAWGVALIEAGCWGEEVVDLCGLLLRRRVDAAELLGRFVVDPPQHAIRVSRALEVARWLVGRQEEEQARPARTWLPSGLPRYRELADAIK
jgi:hypothetical protein